VPPELQINRDHWDEAARIHLQGNVYGVDEFKAGLCRLHRVEVEEVGDVSGKTLLHLQCHFGLDTLSWARRGAKVTGVDYSPAAIEAAKAISRETGVAGEFLCSDLYDIASVLPPARHASFDTIYTSYGVICWLADLATWGEIIARYLKPGGFFYIVEAHPVARLFPVDLDVKQSSAEPFKPFFNYFHDPKGLSFPAGPDYANASATNPHETHEWQHSMGDVVNALTRVGLKIEFIHEFPFCAWPVIAGCDVVVERFSDSHAYYGLPPSQPKIPLMFSLKATKKN
jgi:SAM-dependent methyltransferase